VLAAIPGIALWFFWPQTRITRISAASIREGMTLEQVEGILGGPARDERTGMTCLDEDDLSAEEARRLRSRARVISLSGNGEGANIWYSDEVEILVEITHQGCVSGVFV